jgi:hypothetical protein
VTNPVTRFARGILGGKKTAKVEARVSDELKEGVERRFRELGFDSASEYVDFVLTMDVFGAEHVAMVMQRRISMVRSSSDVRPTEGGLL